jgi:hypothetical protein
MVVLLAFASCLLLVPMVAQAIIMYSYKAELDSIYYEEYDAGETTYFADAGFTIGESFDVDIMINELSSPTSSGGDSNQDYAIYEDAISSFTISKPGYTATGVSSTMVAAVSDAKVAGFDDGIRFSAMFTSTPAIVGVSDLDMSLGFYTDGPDGFSGTTLPSAAPDPTDFDYGHLLMNFHYDLRETSDLFAQLSFTVLPLT